MFQEPLPITSTSFTNAVDVQALVLFTVVQRWAVTRCHTSCEVKVLGRSRIIEDFRTCGVDFRIFTHHPVAQRLSRSLFMSGRRTIAVWMSFAPPSLLGWGEFLCSLSLRINAFELTPDRIDKSDVRLGT